MPCPAMGSDGARCALPLPPPCLGGGENSTSQPRPVHGWPGGQLLHQLRHQARCCNGMTSAGWPLVTRGVQVGPCDSCHVPRQSDPETWGHGYPSESRPCLGTPALEAFSLTSPLEALILPELSGDHVGWHGPGVQWEAGTRPGGQRRARHEPGRAFLGMPCSPSSGTSVPSTPSRTGHG